MAAPLSRNGGTERCAVPVLCLDTCAVLDIMRDPTRDDIRTDEQKASFKLLHAAESGTQLTVLVAEQVHKEFLDNVDDVQKEAQRALSKFRDLAYKLNELATLHGTAGQVDLDHLNGYEIRCRKVAERWLNVATLVPDSQQIVSRAFKRVNQPRTPARKGKASMKDCVILETYLERVRELRKNGLTTPVVFVSSNKKDYAETAGGSVRGDIRAEFTKLGLEYAPNMAAAKHFLKL